MEKVKKILLIEDDPDDIELTLLALNSKRIANKIDVVTDGEEALNYLFQLEKYSGDNAPELPTLVMLDLQLPKISGLVVLKQIRGNMRTKLLPVTIFTSSKEQQDIINSYSLGANSYIRKPVDSDQFDNVIETLGLYWLVYNEDPPKMG